MWTDKMWTLLVGFLLVAGCGGDNDQAGESGASSEDASGEAEARQAAETDRPETIADLFPEGEGKTLVLNNCTSCHAVACSAMGQRTPARWASLAEGHRDRLPGLAEEDFETIFAYLQENFDDTQPEPEIPRAFLQRGCTPN